MSPRDGEGGYGYENEPMTKNERDQLFDRGDSSPEGTERGAKIQGEHAMAWVSRTLQASGIQEEDPFAGLIVHCVQVARGQDVDRDLLLFCIEGAVSARVASRPVPQDTKSAEVERLREALEKIAGLNGVERGFSGDGQADAERIARDALNRETDG